MHDSFDFDAFLTAGVGKLTGYCAAVVGPADAEDAVQEAYFRLWKNLGKLPNEAAARAYLYRTAYRVCVDLLRERKRFPIPEIPAGEPDRLSEETAAALARLSPEDRAVVYGRVVDECGYGELAERFGTSGAWARKR